MCSVHCLVYHVQWTLCSVQPIMWSVQFADHFIVGEQLMCVVCSSSHWSEWPSILCTVFSVQCAVHLTGGLCLRVTIYRVTSHGVAAGLLSTETISAASVAKYGNTAITCETPYYCTNNVRGVAEIRKYRPIYRAGQEMRGADGH